MAQEIAAPKASLGYLKVVGGLAVTLVLILIIFNQFELTRALVRGEKAKLPFTGK